MKFRTKSVVIDAFQLTPESRWDLNEWPEWLRRAWNGIPNDMGSVHQHRLFNLCSGDLVVNMPEGNMVIAMVAEYWLFQGVDDELILCKPDVFEATYEAA